MSPKKKNKGKSIPPEIDPRQPLQPPALPVPRRYLSEQLYRISAKALGDTRISGIDEANRILQEKFINRPLPELLALVKNDPIEEAQTLAYRALDAPTRFEGNRLARQALELDPECIDALHVRAIGTALSTADAVEKLRAVVERAERAMGPEFMVKTEGRFYVDHTTRPYMRARQQLVELYITQGLIDEAIADCRTMLRLNPNDNQGMRDLLLALLLQVKDHAAAQKLIDQYPDDPTAVFAWGRVIAAYQAGGAAAAEAWLPQAIIANIHVYEYLAGYGQLPEESPEYYHPGGADEAYVCIEVLSEAIYGTGFMEWLRLKPIV